MKTERMPHKPRRAGFNPRTARRLLGYVFRPYKVQMAVVLVCSLSALGVTVFSNIALFVLFSVVVYAGYSVSVPVLQSMVASQARPAEKNLVMGFFNATQSLGSIAGSLTAGFIYSVHVKLPFICTFVVYGLGELAAADYMGVKNRK